MMRALLRGWQRYVARRRILWRNRIVVSARARFRLKEEILSLWYAYSHSQTMCELRRRRRNFADEMSARRRYLVVSATFSAWVSTVYQSRMNTLRAHRAHAHHRRTLLGRSVAALHLYSTRRIRLRNLYESLRRLHSSGVHQNFYSFWRDATRRLVWARTRALELHRRIRLKRGLRALQRRVCLVREREGVKQKVISVKARALVIDWRAWTRERLDKRLVRAVLRRAFSGWRDFTRKRSTAEDGGVVLKLRVSFQLRRRACLAWMAVTRNELLARRAAGERLERMVWGRWTQWVRQSCILTAFLTWRRAVLNVPREAERVRLRRSFKGWVLRCTDMRRAARNGKECREMHVAVLSLRVLLVWYRLGLLWQGARRFAEVYAKRRSLNGWREMRKLGKAERRRQRKIHRKFADRIIRVNFYSWHDLCRVRDLMRLKLFRLKRRCIDHLIDFVVDKQFWRARKKEAGRRYDEALLSRSFEGFQQCVERHRLGRYEACLRLRQGLLRKWWLRWMYEGRPVLRQENGRWALAVKCYSGGLMRRAWRGWVGERNRRRNGKSRVREARVVVMRLRAVRRLSDWRSSTERRKQQWKIWQYKALAVASVRDENSLRSAYRFWAVDCMRYASLKRRVRAVAMRYYLLLQWRRWRAGVSMAIVQRRSVEEKAAAHRMVAMARVFDTLRVAVEESLISRYNNSKALFYWADGLCRNVWEQWMLYVDHRRYTGVLRRRASDLLCFNLLRKALEGLQGRMEYRKVHRGVVRRLEAIMEVNLRRRYLSQWKKRLTFEQHLQSCLEVAIRDGHRRLQRRCLIDWHRITRRLLVLRRLVESLQRCLLRSGMRRIVVVMEAVKRRQESLAILVVARWRKFICRKRKMMEDALSAELESSRMEIMVRAEREKEIWTRLGEIRAEITKMKIQSAAGG